MNYSSTDQWSLPIGRSVERMTSRGRRQYAQFSGVHMLIDSENQVYTPSDGSIAVMAS